jgi:hypothetical protein
VGFQLWTAGSNGVDWAFVAKQTDFYNLLVEGLMEGRLSLPLDPDPRLLALPDPYDPVANAPFRIASVTHDLSLFRGRYYIYFGVTPAVTLFLPFRLMTGHSLPLSLAVALFASAATLLASLFVGSLWRLGGLPIARGLGAATLLAVGWGNCLPFILRRPAIYEAAAVSGYFFVALCAWSSARACESRSALRLGLASLAAGLAVGCRPTHLVACLMPLLAGLALKRGSNRTEQKRFLLAAIIPAAAVLTSLLLYNHLRFGDILEFGQSYFLYDYHRGDNLPGLRFLPANLWIQFLSAPSSDPAFPFFRLEPRSLPPLPAGHLVVDPVAGTLVCAPLSLLCILAPLIPRARDGLRRSALWLLALGLLTAGAVATFPAVTARYALDSGLYFVAAGLLVWGWIWSAVRSRAFVAASVLALGAQLVLNTLVSFTGNSDWLKERNGPLYGRIEGAFLPLQRAWFNHNPGRYGPARLRLRFSEGMTRHDEVLVAAGGLYRHNALCVAYLGPRRLRLRFHQRGGNAALESEAIQFEPGRTYALEVEMGSLYPVTRNVLERLYPGRGFFARGEELRVRLDGAEVLRGSYDFVPSAPERVTFGRETVDPQYCSTPFSGEILGVERGFP